MSCTNTEFDCNNPINYSNSNINIDQTINGLDTGSCGLNSILTNISEQLSNLLDSNINIDINNFIQCNETFWNKKVSKRIGGRLQSINLYPSYDDSLITKLIECLKSQNFAQNQINVTIDRITKIKRVINWLFNNKITGSQISNFEAAKTKNFSFNFLCDNTTQSYSTTTFSEDPNCDNNDNCAIKVKLEFQAESASTLDNLRLKDIHSLLCNNGPIICNFGFGNSAFKDFYENAVESTDPDDAVYSWDDQSDSLKDINKQDVCGFATHTVLLTGYECFPNNIDPTHYLFKFKDSFRYGQNGNFRDGYFYIKVPAESINSTFSSKIPWNIGDTYGFGGIRIYGVKVNLTQSVQEVQNAYNECCTTPTPTPTSTPSETETPFPTHTETPS